MKIAFRLILLIVLTVQLPGCKSSNSDRQDKSESEEWIMLFDGKTFNGWNTLGSDTVFTHFWKIEEGILKKVDRGNVPERKDGQPMEGGDLITVESFENYELVFDWKIFKGGNSGLKYNVSEEMSINSGSRHSALGFEYQMLDDADEKYSGKLKASQYTGSLYDLLPASNAHPSQIGSFNTSRIKIEGRKVEHWLNGNKVVEYEFDSPELEEAYKNSKFKDIPGFHHKRKGHIVLQDHTSEAWFKNIKIRKL